MAEAERPEVVTEQHLMYLDNLRESGVVNMFGAASYLKQEFCFSQKEAEDVLVYWMLTYDNRHPEEVSL